MESTLINEFDNEDIKKLIMLYVKLYDFTDDPAFGFKVDNLLDGFIEKVNGE